MDFTREPIIETVITPKEGCKLVVRSSKSTGQEEYFVDAVEVVSFGHSFFFRSLERPKMFFVPATDYEILEVRETRMVLKNVGVDRTIKIAGGREAPMHAHSARESSRERHESSEKAAPEKGEPAEAPVGGDKASDGAAENKRDRRRHSRRRRGRNVEEEEGKEVGKDASVEGQKGAEGDVSLAQQVVTTSILTALLPPPPTLISETIARYKDNALFKDAFYTKEEQSTTPSDHSSGLLASESMASEFAVPPTIPLEQPEYGSFEVTEEEEERIYQQRKLQSLGEEGSDRADDQDMKDSF